MKLKRFIGGTLVAVAALILFFNLILTGSVALVLTGSVINDENINGNLSVIVISLAFFFAGLFLLSSRDFNKS